MNYEQAKKLKKELEMINDSTSQKLQKYETGLMRLTPEHIRVTEEYQKDKEEYDISFKNLRELNAWFMKNYKKEYLKERRENRFK